MAFADAAAAMSSRDALFEFCFGGFVMFLVWFFCFFFVDFKERTECEYSIHWHVRR